MFIDKRIVRRLVGIFVVIQSLTVFGGGGYPQGSLGASPSGPNPSLTPGTLCTHPDAYRYPAHIPYCNRNVDYDTKAKVFQSYRKLGFTIDLSRREDFKIDHYYPLCLGGSNEETNLWPQHKSIFVITDSLEQATCEQLARGKVTQERAVQIVVKGKADLTSVKDLMRELNSL